MDGDRQHLKSENRTETHSGLVHKYPDMIFLKNKMFFSSVQPIPPHVIGTSVHQNRV